MNRGGALAASLLFNVALAALCLWVFLNRSGTSASPSPSPAPISNAPPPRAAKPVNWKMVELPAYSKYLSDLRSVGCPEEVVRQIAISDADKFFAAKNASVAPSHNFEYWKASSPLREHDDQRLELHAKTIKAKQELLKKLLGVEIKDTSTPAEILNPVLDYLAFLPRDKQAAVSEIELDYASRTVRNFGGRITSSQWPEFRQLLDDKYEELRKILTPAEIEEYDYRLSRVAQEIRNNLGEFEPTENEFRSIVKIRKSYEDNFGPYLFAVPGEDAEARNKRETALVEMNRRLKEALGDSRYADYEHEREYRTSSLRIIAQQFNIPKETIFQAFDLRQYAQEAALRIRSDPALSDEQKQASLRRLRDESEKSFKNLLGSDAFDAYMRQSGRWLQNIHPK